jgi:hypothetical protein
MWSPLPTPPVVIRDPRGAASFFRVRGAAASGRRAVSTNLYREACCAAIFRIWRRATQFGSVYRPSRVNVKSLASR